MTQRGFRPQGRERQKNLRAEKSSFVKATLNSGGYIFLPQIFLPYNCSTQMRNMSHGWLGNPMDKSHLSGKSTSSTSSVGLPSYPWE